MLNPKRPILVGLTTMFALALPLTGCSSTENVEAPKTSPASESAEPKTVETVELERFDPATALEISEAGLADIAMQVWLPEALEVTSGDEGVSKNSGLVYLKVGAPWDRTAELIEDGTKENFEYLIDYYQWDPMVPGVEDLEELPKLPGAARWAIMATTTEGDRIVVAVMADDAEDQSLVMVKWEPNASN